MTDKILEVRGLTKTYGGEKKPGAKQPTPTLDVLKGIDIDIYRGDVVCLIGPSGCGKSTFLRCLNRLEIPTGGSIKFEGVEVDDDHIDAVPEFFVKTWLSNLRNLLSSTTWAVLSLVFLAAMLGSALFYLLSRRLVRRKIGFYGTATAFLLLVLTLCFAAIDRREAIDRTSAVVLRDAVAVKSSPDQNSTDLFILHEGTKVEISDRLNGWCEITIADGKKGWMECSTFETI